MNNPEEQVKKIAALIERKRLQLANSLPKSCLDDASYQLAYRRGINCTLNEIEEILLGVPVSNTLTN